MAALSIDAPADQYVAARHIRETAEVDEIPKHLAGCLVFRAPGEDRISIAHRDGVGHRQLQRDQKKSRTARPANGVGLDLRRQPVVESTRKGDLAEVVISGRLGSSAVAENPVADNACDSEIG